MPYARRTSFLDDLKWSWKETTKKTAQKGDPDALEKVANGLSILASMYYVRHQLRKKGAPEWLAYGISMVDLSISQIAMRLYFIERQLLRQRQSRIQITDLSLRPGESASDALNRLREKLLER